MGEMAEMYDYLLDEEDDDVKAYFDNGPAWLVEHSAPSRRPIVMSIRRQWAERGWISRKQQWVLAYWVAEHDREYS